MSFNCYAEGDDINLNLKKDWNSRSRTSEQTERLLELFPSLSGIPEIEQFISLFKDFDTALKFSRSPYLVEKYKNYLAQLQSKLDVESSLPFAKYN